LRRTYDTDEERHRNDSEGERDVIKVKRLGSNVASIVKGVGTRARESGRDSGRDGERERTGKRGIPRGASKSDLSYLDSTG
jgi:hypothetical protein